MPELKLFYVQERWGDRVIWTSDPLTKRHAIEYKKLLESEKEGTEQLTTYHLVRSYEDSTTN